MANTINAAEVKTIILACEAGMGSSLMSVNSLKKRFKKANIAGVTIVHKPVREIPANTKLIIVHKGLAKTAQGKAPDAVVVAFNHFIKDPAFDKIVNAFSEGSDIEGAF